MLEHLGETNAAKDIECALEATLMSGIKTYDLGGSATTRGFAEAIASQLKS
jgi:isocitrate/isopropylmalate dehydrogenase